MSEDRFDRLESKLDDKFDRVEERLDKVDVGLAKYNQQLEYHIKRTDLSEGRLDMVESHILKVNAITNFFMKIVGFGAPLIGAIYYLMRIFRGE
jgi:hypothetical protein